MHNGRVLFAEGVCQREAQVVGAIRHDVSAAKVCNAGLLIVQDPADVCRATVQKSGLFVQEIFPFGNIHQGMCFARVCVSVCVCE